MAKSLIYIHLESLPQMLFWQYQAELPTLWRLKEESLYCTRCFTTGAATVFAYNSIFRGCVEGLDHLASYSYDDSHRLRAGEDSVVAALRDGHGYQTAFLLYNTHAPAGPMPQEEAAYGFETHLADSPYCRENAALCGWLDVLDRDRPFLVYMHYLIDLLHHRLPSGVLMENIRSTAGDMSALMMRLLDRAVADTLARFSERGLLEDAVTVVFGDHGWDYAQRFNSPAFQQGAHVSSSSAWVPLFIHNSRLGRGVSNQLVSLDDFPAGLADLVTDGACMFRPRGLYAGVNFLRETRDFAFTQNKFALQSTTLRGNETPKSYAVTDGMYRLVVEDVDGNKGGLALYLEQLDPGNQANLLDLFVLGGEGEVAGLNHDVLQSGKLMSYPPLLNIPGLAALAERYRLLHSRLRRFVRDKEAQALSWGGAPGHAMAEEAFRLPAGGRSRDNGGGLDAIAARLRAIAVSERPVLLFGSRTFITSYVLAVMEYYRVPVVGFMDNMPSEQYGTIGGLTVWPPAEAAEKYPGALVISCVCSSVSSAGVMRQCGELRLECLSYVGDIIGSRLW